MIREYTPQDEDPVVSVWYEASELAHPFLSKSFMKETETTIREQYLPKAETWVSEKDGQVAGFISLLGNEVGALFLAPEFHGKGMGRQLMDKAVSLRGKLTVGVFRENPIGRRFYEAYGFRFVDEYIHPQTGHPTLNLAFDPGS
jgi:putative acetyltransferase